MLPDLREGMMLELRAREAHVGDVVVFTRGSKLLAHRAIRIGPEQLICCGDAQPDYLEYVPRESVVGVVQAVYDRGGRRADSAGFRLRGLLRARLHGLRTLARLGWPRTRARTYDALAQLMSACMRGDAAALDHALEASTQPALAAMARRHRCGAALCAALERIAAGEQTRGLHAMLLKERWQASLRRERLLRQVLEAADVLKGLGLRPVFLKGAQRAICGLPESEFFDSRDIDVLVPADAVQTACAAFRDRGFRQCVSEVAYEDHHHAAPLHRAGSMPIEVHRALYPAALMLPNDYAELRTRMRLVNLHGRSIAVLDDVGSALHLAVHCLQRPALRELVLLGLQLQRLDAYERNVLRGLLQRERRYAVQIEGALVFAARLAGVDWQGGPMARRYADWMLVREDLPRPLRARTFCVDAFVASAETPLRDALVASRENGGGARSLCYVLAGAGIAAYVKLMRR